MRKLLYAVVAVVVCGFMGVGLTGCKDKATSTDDSSTDSTLLDTATAMVEEVEEDIPMPRAADEIFDDFIFNFASNGRLQRERILFPLVVYKGERTDTIEQNQWEKEPFFMEQDFYTVILDNENQLASVNDSATTHVRIEKIYLESGYVTQYLFDKENGQWRMTAINDTTFRGTPREDFLNFYTKFTTDTLFQVESVNDQFKFIGPDPDDDFATMEGVILPEQWTEFAPDLPREMLYNVMYGLPAESGTEKLFVIRGIANGLETELSFRKKDGHWKLTQIQL